MRAHVVLQVAFLLQPAREQRGNPLARLGQAERGREGGLSVEELAGGRQGDLIAQAATAALTEGSAEIEDLAGKSEQDRRTGLIDTYLSKEHRDSPGIGCALVTLGAAAGRGDQSLKEAYEKRVRGYLTRFGGDGSEEARAEALITLSALVGATLLSRAVADPALADELLETVAQQLEQR
ncbi:hypothetical protein [Streptomyces sp. NPDC101234]|uniref:hypothetical protein n=1 Tax=Streptomyces sp. NPDC101234 TaxID=3366138 RepID=UPI00382DF9D8